jgi:hypothetical protein
MSEPYKEIQSAVDSLLNVKSTIRRKKRNQSDKKKEMFFAIITLMEETIVRTNIAYQELQIDMFKYEEKFINVIDMLMNMQFGEQACELISYYLYDRMNPDGTINALQSDDGKLIELTSPYQLWEIVLLTNPKILE